MRMLLAWSTPLISALLLGAALELYLTRPAEAAVTVFSDPVLAAPRTLVRLPANELAATPGKAALQRLNTAYWQPLTHGGGLALCSA